MIGISENEVYTMDYDGTPCKVIIINNLLITSSTRNLPDLGGKSSAVILVADQFILSIGGRENDPRVTTVSCLDLHASNP